MIQCCDYDLKQLDVVEKVKWIEFKYEGRRILNLVTSVTLTPVYRGPQLRFLLCVRCTLCSPLCPLLKECMDDVTLVAGAVIPYILVVIGTRNDSRIFL